THRTWQGARPRRTIQESWQLVRGAVVSSDYWQPLVGVGNMSCGNTHTPETVTQAAQTARQPAHPQLPPVQARPQPPHLRHGKERHEVWRAEQTAWAKSVGHEAEAKEVTVEKASSGKPGRIDQVTWIDPDHEGAVITDFKTTRFDNYSEAKVAS